MGPTGHDRFENQRFLVPVKGRLRKFSPCSQIKSNISFARPLREPKPMTDSKRRGAPRNRPLLLGSVGKKSPWFKENKFCRRMSHTGRLQGERQRPVHRRAPTPESGSECSAKRSPLPARPITGYLCSTRRTSRRSMPGSGQARLAAARVSSDTPRARQPGMNRGISAGSPRR